MPSLGDAKPFVPDWVWIPNQEVPCGQAPDMFTSTKMGRFSKAELAWMRDVCRNQCPLTDECLEAAMREEGQSGLLDRNGMRGGLTARERWRLHRRRKTSSRRRLSLSQPGGNNGNKETKARSSARSA